MSILEAPPAFTGVEELIARNEAIRPNMDGRF
jgi:hypothetical protein